MRKQPFNTLRAKSKKSTLLPDLRVTDCTHETCCGKRKFSRADAAYILNDILRNKRGKKYRREARSYFCSQCHAWHLTSVPLDEWNDRIAAPDPDLRIRKELWLPLLHYARTG